MMEKIEMLEKQISTNHDQLRKAIDDNHFVVKRIEQEMKTMEDKMKAN
jgi:hypothetical protein